MLNYLWAAMILIGVVTGMCTGRMAEVSEGFVEASKEAVDLCLTMLGIMAVWTGVLKIARKAGLLEKMAHWLRPVIHWLFPEIEPDHPAGAYISTNFVANILGLGWAATPAGLEAMKALGSVEEEKAKQHRPHFEKGTASSEMCTFLVMNISSLQLIPVSIIAYRSQYGSSNPTLITGPAIAATMVSTAAGAVLCLIMSARDRRRLRRRMGR